MLMTESPQEDEHYRYFKNELKKLQANIDSKTAIDDKWTLKLIQFYKAFDKWHCGLNQLKTFKKLPFAFTCPAPEKIKA